jgi:SpoVK/Ycf46/Vps4 family AAA+-type ATPase
MATNRADTLDPALLRPGRLDRKIEFPLPSRRERRLIFQTVTNKMNLGPDVDLEDCSWLPLLYPMNGSWRSDIDVSRPDRLSSADIASIAQAAGLQGEAMVIIFSLFTYLISFAAVRKNRYVILPVDFEEAWKVSNLLLFGHLLFKPKKILSKPWRGLMRRMNSVSRDDFCAWLYANGGIQQTGDILLYYLRYDSCLFRFPLLAYIL